MKIIILGVGTVGSTLAILLSQEDNDITVIDKDESVEEALKREVKEETGLQVSVGEILAVKEYPRQHKMFGKIKALRFLAYYESGEVKLSKEHKKFEWLTFDEAIKKIAKKENGYEKEKKETVLQAKKYLEMKDALENWKRCLADFDNYKKRLEEARKDTIKYATENIILQLLPIIDNFESSVAHIPNDKRDEAWTQGIMYIKKQLEDVLRGNGVEEIGVKVGDNFDATVCEAIDDNNCNDDCKQKKKFKNKIKKIVLRGYKIGNKVIRPARVVVE